MKRAESLLELVIGVSIGVVTYWQASKGAAKKLRRAARRMMLR